jgi:succinate dehydrogenase / fumarate reductase, iron-sulfur subunit
MGDTKKTFRVRVLRQPAPGAASHWESFQVERQPDMNVISVLQWIAANPVTERGQQTTPVAWDCACLEEVCGSCTMVINGKVRQSCSALVDNLLAKKPDEIELQPMRKFPVVRDLVVDRSRLFTALKKSKAWVPVDNYQDMGPGPKQSRAQQEMAYPLSECMSCGCCLDACPQYVKVEVARLEGESDEEYAKRCDQEYNQHFIGAHAISQIMLHNMHPTGKALENERLDTLMEPGGIQVCGNAQNCVAVCPKLIPLTRSIGRAGRATTWRSFKRMFDT